MIKSSVLKKQLVESSIWAGQGSINVVNPLTQCSITAPLMADISNVELFNLTEVKVKLQELGYEYTLDVINACSDAYNEVYEDVGGNWCVLVDDALTIFNYNNERGIRIKITTASNVVDDTEQ